VINPHKWLGAAFDCTTYYVRDPQHLVRVMSTNPSYLRTSVDDPACRGHAAVALPLPRNRYKETP